MHVIKLLRIDKDPFQDLFGLVFHKKYSTFVCKSTENLESLKTIH